MRKGEAQNSWQEVCKTTVPKGAVRELLVTKGRAQKGGFVTDPLVHVREVGKERKPVQGRK
jgi:hypothetical protein